MADIIKLLPESIANQIAAGEVVQRPASALKELLENAIDAQAKQITVIIEKAGKQRIQVNDNGIGMTETDARMAFERHATSKISKAEDLGRIVSLGFRGEALASIAAVAQVELKTRHASRELGTVIKYHGSKLIKQEPCAHPIGTSITINNLFFNTPARKRFLKSDAVEMKHIIEEFYRIALAHPEIAFSLHHNGKELYRLMPGNLRQRIRYLFKRKKDETKWVAIDEHTQIVNIHGYISKPEFAKKNRSEQYFFVNQRFIKSSYLNHAIQNAYAQLLPPNHYPGYVIFLELAPDSIDINVHPTKHEIKFEDERLIYRYLHVSVRHTLGRYHINPTLNFDPQSKIFDRPNDSIGISHKNREQKNLEDWRTAFKGIEHFDIPHTTKKNYELLENPDPDTIQNTPKIAYQIYNRFIVSQIKSGAIIIDQKAAHERILYEQLKQNNRKETASQALLFPITLKSLDQYYEIIQEHLELLSQLGYGLESFGQHRFILRAIPVALSTENYPEQRIESDLEQLIIALGESKMHSDSLLDELSVKLAKQHAMKVPKQLKEEEILDLISRLFSCSMPYERPGGGFTLIRLELEELEKRFK